MQTGQGLPWIVCEVSGATTEKSSQSFQGFLGIQLFSVFHCCWAVCVFLCLTSPIYSVVHLPLLFQRLCRFSSDPLQAFCHAPANSTFLSLLQAQCISEGWEGEGKTFPFYLFPPPRPRISSPSFPQHFWEKWETLHKINFPPKQLLRSELFIFLRQCIATEHTNVRGQKA